MIVRNLMWGALMLGVGAMFTFMLATAMQQHATVAAPSNHPGAPAVAGDKRSDQQWMF